ncbi:MAG: ATP-binding protein [Candidatus Nanoarchaeia archaeon]
MELAEILKILNPWWLEAKVSKELALPYKRKIFSKFLELLNYRQIIIASGLRRVGKTTLLYQLIETLLKKTEPKTLLYFNFDKRVEELTEIFNNYSELTGVDWKKAKIFVFLDEITKLSDWASKIKLIYDAFPNIKFIVSSSSSTALEKEAIKNLAGRYFLVNIKPLSFVEYLELRGKADYIKDAKLRELELKKECQLYLLRSFPEIVSWENEYLIKDYLKTTIIDKIIKEDLPEKFKNVRRELLLKLLELFYSEPGAYLDYDGLSRKLGISKKTLLRHIFFLEFSYLIKIIRNFRPGLFVASRKLQKAYANWWTLAYNYTANYDKIMKNVVASTADVKYYWRKDGKEIDFLLVEDKKLIPIEVKNKTELTKYELSSMKYFLEKYKIKNGLIIYNGEERDIRIKDKRIKFMPLWRWLLYEDQKARIG